ncbi:hypothetical protein LCGC14_0435090 [marine sediment metagenome]|uniref:Uncharacterized protein n=1 Tax=marine sediment metagenome TaxID=412755 RepID=A0A0F9T563_9ZZZZ
MALLEGVRQGREGGGGTPLTALIGGIVTARRRRVEENKARQIEEEALERELKILNEKATQDRITGLQKAKQEGLIKKGEQERKFGFERRLGREESRLESEEERRQEKAGLKKSIILERIKGGEARRTLEREISLGLKGPGKKTAAQEKREVEIGELEGQAKNLITLFRSARKEAGTIPKIGTRGILGRAAGQVAIGKGKLGFSPAVNVFQDKTKAFATIVAKAAGEVRPTDKDIERFMGTLPTLSKNDAENKIIIEQLVGDLRAKGAKAVWAQRGKNQEVKEGQTSSGIKFTIED